MFHSVDPKLLDLNPFAAIGDQWMLITAGTKERCNTMTASWGGVGVLWGKNVATAYIRPQRYTKEFVDAQGYFTLSFFGEAYRKALNLCGSRSGRDVDKVRECGFTVAEAACGAPYFEQAGLVLVTTTPSTSGRSWRPWKTNEAAAGGVKEVLWNKNCKRSKSTGPSWRG